ncbi:MAG: PKD domain-containing protein [Bacteroidetes bacterium]|nr:PKD domain-containing protein [Bacteroidota bacterium]
MLMLIAEVNGQIPFQRVYGGSGFDNSADFKQTSDSGYILLGHTLSFGAGSNDIYIVKTDQAGDTIWTRVYGGASADVGASVIQTSDGGYLIAGTTFSFALGILGDMFLIKTNSMGDTTWTRTYGDNLDESANSVIQTSDGNYVLCGSTENFGAGSYDVSLLKIDVNGDTIWTKTYGRAGVDNGVVIRETSDGGLIIAGSMDSLGLGNYDALLIRTDQNGDTLWTKTYAGPVDEYFNDVQETSDGGFICVGVTDSYGAGSLDYYVVRTDSLGDTLWTKCYGSSNIDFLNSVIETPDNGFLLAGHTNGHGSGIFDIYLIKINNVGDTLWSKVYGGTQNENVQTIINDVVGGYTMFGHTRSAGAGFSDFYLIHSDVNGDNQTGCNFSSTITKINGTSLTIGGGLDVGYGITITDTFATASIGSPALDSVICSGCFTLTGGYIYTVSLYTGSFDYIGKGANTLHWDFGDGDTSIVNSPQHTYAGNGSYNVCLTVTNPCTTVVVCKTVVVNCVLSISKFGFADSSLTVTFTDSSSNASTWFWDFDDTKISLLQYPTHTFTASGTYNVCLITSNLCGFDTSCQLVTVICMLPVADFSYNDVGFIVNFSDSSDETLSWMWDFGDSITSNMQSPVHVYSGSGNYDVCLIVTNNCGKDTLCKTITICTPPTANFGYITSGRKVTFSNLTSDIDSLSWDFGDGNTDTSQNPVHTYASNDDYVVCLTVYNICNADTQCDTITVFFNSVMEPLTEPAILIYPNPFITELTIEITNLPQIKSEEVYFTMYNLVGKAMKTIKLESDLEKITLNDLPPGFYFYKISNLNGVVHSGKLIKE